MVRHRIELSCARQQGGSSVHDYVEAVAPRHEDRTGIARSLDDLGLDVDREELVRHHYVRPFDYLGIKGVSEAVGGADDVPVAGQTTHLRQEA